MAMAGLVERHKGLRSLNLTGNHIRDEAATAIVKSLKTNIDILAIRLSGNSIDLKLLRAVDSLLERNRELAEKRKLPLYARQVDRFKLGPNDYARTTSMIAQMKEEYERVRTVAATNEAALRQTEEEQKAKTKLVEEKKRAIDLVCRKVDIKIAEVDEAMARVRESSEHEVKGIIAKTDEALRMIGRFSAESKFAVLITPLVVTDLKAEIESREETQKKEVESWTKKLENERTKMYCG